MCHLKLLAINLLGNTLTIYYYFNGLQPHNIKSKPYILGFNCAGTMTLCELDKRNMPAITGCSCITLSVTFTFSLCSRHLLDDALGGRLKTVWARLCVFLLSARVYRMYRSASIRGCAAHAILLVRCISVCVTSPLNLRYEMWLPGHTVDVNICACTRDF